MKAAIELAWKRLQAEFGLRELFVFGGLASAVYGISQVSEPAAWVIGGAVLFWLGVRRVN